MTSFKDSFNKGLDSANQSIKNKEEIKEVFTDLNKELSELTGNKIEVLVHTFSEKLESPTATASIFGSVLEEMTRPKYRDYQGIGARNPSKNSSIHELATWSQGRSGYPCKVKFGSKAFICEDKEGLIEALSELLEDPETGEIFQRLMET
ncbi:hypothetical protein [Marinobacter zhanjiangensis]|uniref:Uncharacterized protein n=1 Tax=Marinobacter zhanjiangensis TaxID=578215 RepID=A0ABQ3AZG0_9GAMM|nr:hypothetical protein [Marinobacter zhanjiangensis]GGY68764.1 hypothetical protein GCM10007071_14520 [Marinobacter zhanjiangensis]